MLSLCFLDAPNDIAGDMPSFPCGNFLCLVVRVDPVSPPTQRVLCCGLELQGDEGIDWGLHERLDQFSNRDLSLFLTR